LAAIRWTIRSSNELEHEKMDLRKVITDSSDINEDLVVYAKKIDGRFLSSSEAVLLQLTEEELDLKTNEIADRKCPGFSYFLEMFLVKEMMEEFENIEPEKDIEQKIATVIHYAEFDA
jgi:hypothetical protein